MICSGVIHLKSRGDLLFTDGPSESLNPSEGSEVKNSNTSKVEALTVSEGGEEMEFGVERG